MNIGGDKQKLFKRIVLFGPAIAIYIFLSSTIYSAQQEVKMFDFLTDSMLEIADIKKSYYSNTVNKEKELTHVSADNELQNRLKGKILLQVETGGSAWYLNPGDLKRYFLGKPNDAIKVIRSLAEVLTQEQIVDFIYFDKTFPREYEGKFIINKDKSNEYYYVIPDSLEALKLNSINEFFTFFSNEGLGISNSDIRKIEVGEL